MSSYCDLIGFEYKKIFRKRSTVIILLLGVLLAALSSLGNLLGNHYIDGEVFESHYEGMIKDREYRRGLAGREVNSDLLAEAIEAYSHIPVTEGIYADTDEYQKYARPYSEIYHLIRRVYNLSSVWQLSSIPRESLDDFYKIRQSAVEKEIENTTMSAKEKAGSIELSRKVKTPFVYSYTGGYERFFSQMQATALLICFICLICLSPLFAGEYTDGMDNLVFSARYGKNKIICAKIFTGISFTVLISILLLSVSYFTVMTVYGWDGANSPFQLDTPLSVVPYTMGQVALKYSVLVLFGNLLSSVFTMLLSSKLKSPFLVLAIMTAITVIPGFVSVSDNILWLYHLYNLIPVNTFNIDNVISIYSIDLLGFIIRPYEFIIAFAAVSSVALLPVIYRNFKNHD